MNKLLFDEVSYDVAINGVNASPNTFVAKLVTDDFDGVEANVAPIQEIIQTLEDGTRISTYKGYTKLVSINKLFNQIVDYEEKTHTEERPVVNPETGEPVIDPKTGEQAIEVLAVTETVPVYADVLVITLFQPTLEDTVAEQGEEIEEIQEVIMELVEA